jgi:hypothetical protein
MSLLTLSLVKVRALSLSHPDSTFAKVHRDERGIITMKDTYCAGDSEF